MRRIACCVWILSVFRSVFSSTHCFPNCSTVSLDNSFNTQNFISCSLQSMKCQPFLPFFGSPTKPDLIGADWFFYPDPENTGFQKIGLNISWSPGDDSSIAQLIGYEVTLSDFTVIHNKYFCFSNQLEYKKHIKAIFSYNCFEYLDNLVLKPEQAISVIIRSLPKPSKEVNDQKLSFNVVVPSCEDPRMEKVYECHQKYLFTMSVSSLSCENRSAVISYNVPPIYGKNAMVLLGKMNSFGILSTPIDVWKNQSLNQKLHLSLPKEYSLNDTYTVVVWGKAKAHERRHVFLNFTSCLNKKQFHFPVAYVVVPIVSFLLFALCPVFIYKYLHHKRLKHLMKKSFNPVFDLVSSDATSSRVSGTSNELPLKRTKVFIVFADDHPYHREVILSFSSFLEGDLGFDVVLELYQTKEVFADPVGWMEKSLNDSDKVIVVWSPGATERWRLYNETNDVESDFFSPVIKAIYKDLFRGKNLLKYVFVYFDYCSKTDIPSDFREKYFHLHYKLMQQIDELYFRLKDMEKYAPGTVIKQAKADFQHYFDSKINQYGKTLQFKIFKMCKYVKENPLWYKEQNEDFKSPLDSKINIENLPDEIMSVQLDIVPPEKSLPCQHDQTYKAFAEDKAELEISVITSQQNVMKDMDRISSGSVLNSKALKNVSCDSGSSGSSGTLVGFPNNHNFYPSFVLSNYLYPPISFTEDSSCKKDVLLVEVNKHIPHSTSELLASQKNDRFNDVKTSFHSPTANLNLPKSLKSNANVSEHFKSIPRTSYQSKCLSEKESLQVSDVKLASLELENDPMTSLMSINGLVS